MNKLVENWKVCKDDLQPDGITIDGDHIMAERKNPQTEYVEDSSAADDTDLRQTHLPKKHFNTYVRFVKSAPIDSVKQVRTETYNNLKRLGVKRDLTKAPGGVPKGSDQVDVGTLVRFLRSIDSSHTKAVEQLIALDAACCKRFE